MSNDALTTPRIMYYQITFTLDKRIRGRYKMPHTVKIKSKDFLDYMSEKNRNILMYFKNEHDIYINMPDEIEGQIIKRKDYVDFMDFSPACLSLKAVVSAKVKNVLELNGLFYEKCNEILRVWSIVSCTCFIVS